MTEYEYNELEEYERLDAEMHKSGSYEVLAGILLCVGLVFGAVLVFLSC